MVSVPFETAFETLKKACVKVDARNKKVHSERIKPNYRHVVQIALTDRAEGILYVEFSNSELHVFSSTNLVSSVPMWYTVKKAQKG